MKFIGYTAMAEDEFEYAILNDEDVIIFSTLETFYDVYGQGVPYSTIEYYDYDDIHEN